MAYGDYDGPDKPNKGQEGGACNRQRCQAEPANWYNHGSHAWYCDDCARDIGQDSFNLRDWQLNYEPYCKHPMFETREQMDAQTLNVPEQYVQDVLRDLQANEITHVFQYDPPPAITEFHMEKRVRQAPRPRDQYHNHKRF